MRKLLLFAMLLGLMAAPVQPARAVDPVQQAIQNAVSWLHTQQKTDGSFGSASVTADAVYALKLAGEDPAAWIINGHTALEGLATTAPGYVCPSGFCNDAGRAGRVARAVALAGLNPRNFAGMDLISIIQSRYDAATGHYLSGTPLYGHTLAVEGLLRAGQPVPDAALNALFAAQITDGGWFWSWTGAASDVDSTGRVMQLLAGPAQARCNAAAYGRAADFLDAAQRSNAGWGVYPPPDANPSNANSTALAVAGLKAIGLNPDGPRFQAGGVGALQNLIAACDLALGTGFREPSGAFAYICQPGKQEVRIMATIDTLIALAAPLAAPTCKPAYLPVIIRM